MKLSSHECLLITYDFFFFKEGYKFIKLLMITIHIMHLDNTVELFWKFSHATKTFLQDNENSQ